MTTKSGIIIIIMPKTKSRIEYKCKTKVIYRPKGKYRIIFDIINVATKWIVKGSKYDLMYLYIVK